MPSAREHFGGIASNSIPWNVIEHCQARPIASEAVPNHSFVALEIRVAREAMHLLDTYKGTLGTQTTADGLIVGDESWTWSADGMAFLEAGSSPDELLKLRHGWFR